MSRPSTSCFAGDHRRDVDARPKANPGPGMMNQSAPPDDRLREAIQRPGSAAHREGAALPLLGLSEKTFDFLRKSPAQSPHPVPPEGRSRTSRTWGQAAVGARPRRRARKRADVRREPAPAKPCGPDAPRAGVKFLGSKRDRKSTRLN